MSQAVAPWLPLWKPVVGGSIRAVGAFHTICWLRVWGLPMVSTVTISLVAGVGPARISVMLAVSIISRISLVTLNNAPVALENLFMWHIRATHVSRGLMLELSGGACDRGRSGAAARTAGVARLRMIH